MSAKLHGRLRSHLSLWAIGAFSLAVTSFGPSVAFGQDAHALKPPAPLLKVETDLARGSVELAALGGKAKVVDFKRGVGVAGVDHIVKGSGRQGEAAEQGKQK